MNCENSCLWKIFVYVVKRFSDSENSFPLKINEGNRRHRWERESVLGGGRFSAVCPWPSTNLPHGHSSILPPAGTGIDRNDAADDDARTASSLNRISRLWFVWAHESIMWPTCTNVSDTATHYKRKNC